MRTRMKLVSFLRIKNAIETIDECLIKLSEISDAIVIVDNGSTDGTLAAYKKYPKIKTIMKTKGFDEGRDKRLALKEAKKLKPDWLLWIDADEIFEDAMNREYIEQIMSQDKYSLVSFRMFNFWKSKDFYRIDGRWGRYTAEPQRHMWRNMKSAYFINTKFHNGAIQGVEGANQSVSIA